jgi:hypothetical protein
MTKPKQTWRGKWLAKEEGGSNCSCSGEEASKITPARGEENPRLGDGNPQSDNCNPDSGSSNPGKENDWQGEELVPMDINMVFTIPKEFCVPMEDVTDLALGAERAVFEKS